ncbi:hypothetical protein C8R47DRAFT_1192429 [Mycena vitilis]|nr:hypothetical protein C8R47DRAFT_1192429 [Mycena vitilis]
MHRLFFNIKQLLPFQRKFLAKMDIIQQLPWQEQRWGELLLDSRTYCTNWYTDDLPDMRSDDTRVCNRVEQMRESLAVFESNLTRNLSRGLIAPVAHFHTYPVLLKPLLDTCSTESYAHYDELKSGLAALEGVIERWRSFAYVWWTGTVTSSTHSAHCCLITPRVFGVIKDDVDPQGCQAYLLERGILFCVRPLGVSLAHHNMHNELTPLRVESLVQVADVVRTEVVTHNPSHPGIFAYGYHLRDRPEPDPFLQTFETTRVNFANSAEPSFLSKNTPAKTI